MNKKRVEWKVRLTASNLLHNEGKLIPQVILTRSYTLDDVVARMADNGSPMTTETLRCAATMLMNEIEDCLLEGASVSTPLGTLTPSVTGVWNTANRLLPEARQQNTATVRYSLSPRMKKALTNPLFQEENGTGFRLSIYSVQDTASHTENERLTPGRTIVLRGHFLLMNGDLPQCGIYLVDATNGQPACHIAPEELVLNTRGRIIAQVPHDLPKGEYLIRVVSQCSTSPQPMKQAAEYTTKTPLMVD